MNTYYAGFVQIPNYINLAFPVAVGVVFACKIVRFISQKSMAYKITYVFY